MSRVTPHTRLWQRALPVLAPLLVFGCASNIPAPIKSPPAEDLSLTRVQQEPQHHQGKIIRWGGTIISTQNQQSRTEVTILAKALDSYGEPQPGDQSYGRFITLVNGFLDPAIYAPGRMMTVYGKFTKLLNKPIDKFDYQYPLVEASQYYLWDVPEKYDYYDYPYWYDPWYPYPYYHPYWRRH